jgi:hypothetical protein
LGTWGVKSYENDDASDALDAAFDRVHGARYDDLMEDRNPMTFDQVQEELADPTTLAVALGCLVEEFGPDPDVWDEEEKLAMAGVVVRHAEFGVPVPEEWKARAIAALEGESIDWEEATIRDLRRRKEIAILRKSS